VCKGRISFGVLGGVNFQNINGKDWDDSKLENNLIVGYAVMGKSIEDDTKTNIEFKKVVETTDPLTTCYYKAFDAGGNLWVGYEMSMGLFFQLNTQLGMININPEDKRIPDDKSAYKNTGFGLSVGYRFNR